MRTSGLSLGAAAILASAVHAQTIEVPEDYAELQDAIDAAPADATIVVHGGSWSAITIDKPIRIVGDPMPMFWGGGPAFAFESPITLAGPGNGDVVLSNVRVGMFVSALGWLDNAPGIRGGGFDALYVYDSTITGPDWSDVYNWVFPGAPAIDTTVPFVWCERSSITGSDTEASQVNVHSPFSNPTPLGADAGTAIVSTGTVVVFDSTLRGGDGDDISYDSPDCSFSCPGGDGGSGVVCERLIHANSTFAGGAPTDWLDETGLRSRLCCSGLPGVPVAATTEVALAQDLIASGPLRLGQSFTLNWPRTELPPILIASVAPTVILDADAGLFFLDPKTVFLLDVPREAPRRTLRIPSDPALLGVGFAFQLRHPSGVFSRPVSGVVIQ